MEKSTSRTFAHTQLVCIVTAVAVIGLVGMCLLFTAIGVSKEMFTINTATYIGFVLQVVCVYAGMRYVNRGFENSLTVAMYYVIAILIMQLCVSFLIFEGINTNYFLNLASVITASLLGLYTKKYTYKHKKMRKKRRGYR